MAKVYIHGSRYISADHLGNRRHIAQYVLAARLRKVLLSIGEMSAVFSPWPTRFSLPSRSGIWEERDGRSDSACTGVFRAHDEGTVRLLLEIVRGRPTPPESVTLRHTLIVRSSTAPPAHI